eukprot:TRINITY_DN7609_c0_g1_i1.p1 TRINITY_DN7609_c0_g1~~TRINITY_DN7609_c0_g1_i1.p1  ORF type:complete len:374 (+),score=55.35 TRINITY_DN7609_c0_g1_i1:71-1123(+)
MAASSPLLCLLSLVFIRAVIDCCALTWLVPVRGHHLYAIGPPRSLLSSTRIKASGQVSAVPNDVVRAGNGLAAGGITGAVVGAAVAITCCSPIGWTMGAAAVMGAVWGMVRGFKAADNEEARAEGAEAGLMPAMMAALVVKGASDIRTRNSNKIEMRAFLRLPLKVDCSRSCFTGCSGRGAVRLARRVGRLFFKSGSQTPSSKSGSSTGPSQSDSSAPGLTADLCALLAFLGSFVGNQLMSVSLHQTSLRPLELLMPNNNFHSFVVIELLADTASKFVRLDWCSDEYWIEERSSLGDFDNTATLKKHVSVKSRTTDDLATIIGRIQRPYSLSTWNCNHWSSRLLHELSEV